MVTAWQFGKSGETRDVHWLYLGLLSILVRAVDLREDADWEVLIALGMTDKLSDDEGHPIRFPHAELEAAKAAGLQHAVKVVTELLAEVNRCAA